MKHLEKTIGIILLLFAIGFNLWIYRLEPTAKSDPNDNTFQFALVDRTNQIWDFANKKCSDQFGAWNLLLGAFCKVSYLADHWVPNWAQGYNLPYYYSHIPQILIVTSYRLIRGPLALLQGAPPLQLFTYYHWVIYLLLSFFPLSLFLALRIIGVSWIASGFGALIASQLSTDGLYGLDPASFLWRGWGLSSQLFAMIWLPLAIAYSFRYFAQNSKHQASNDKQIPSIKHQAQKVSNIGILKLFEIWNLGFGALPAIFFLAATTVGHLGIGIIAFMSVAIVSISHLGDLGNLGNLKQNLKKLFLLYGGVLLLLGYWIIPILKDGTYHNISVWDGIWKFDSFGYREVLKNLFNGDLFDFGRFPILTILVFVGFFSSLFSIGHVSFGILFIFWLLLYFGRTTWGGLFNLIPGMSEFHLSRFIVGVHIAGLFLIPMGVDSFKKNKFVLCVLLALLVLFGVFPQTLRYAAHNDFLIKRANENFAKDAADMNQLLSAISRQLSDKPGRVFAGRGGSWGKDFRIAETPIYMYLSTYGVPTILWLPETWSPNSDTEQYFSEGNLAHYSLYNVRYVVTPIDLDKQYIQSFWKPLETGKTWRLYEVATEGYITSGVRPAIISTSKTDYRSLVRLWMHSDYPKQGLYPELTFDTNYPKQTGLPNFRMLDEVTYKIPDGSTHNLFSEIPVYISTLSNLGNLTITSQKNQDNMIFSATVSVPTGCSECLVILKQSFHPSWRATINGKPAQTMTVFPFYVAISVSEGRHEVVFSYQPSGVKIFLLLISLITLISLTCLTGRRVSLILRSRIPRAADTPGH